MLRRQIAMAVLAGVLASGCGMGALTRKIDREIAEERYEECLEDHWHNPSRCDDSLLTTQ